MSAPLMSLVTVLSLAAAVVAARAQELSDELSQLQGTWRLTSNSCLGNAQPPTAGATGATYQEKISTIRIEGRLLTIGDSRLPVELRCGNVPALLHLPEGTELLMARTLIRPRFTTGLKRSLRWPSEREHGKPTAPRTKRCSRLAAESSGMDRLLVASRWSQAFSQTTISTAAGAGPRSQARSPKNRPAGAESGSANRIPPDDVEGGQSPSGHAAGRRANRITIV
jgi:hypothetical protein